jgi:hypothetical protein
MPYALEKWGKNKAIVVNKDTGRHFSLKPLPISKAVKQMRLLYLKSH